MVETAITVALMAVATISVVTLFGNNLRSVFGASAQALAGEAVLANPAQKDIPAGITSKTLRNFAESASGGGSGGGVRQEAGKGPGGGPGGGRSPSGGVSGGAVGGGAGGPGTMP